MRHYSNLIFKQDPIFSLREIIDTDDKSLLTHVVRAPRHSGIPLYLGKVGLRQRVAFYVQKLDLLLRKLLVDQFGKLVEGEPESFVSRGLVRKHSFFAENRSKWQGSKTSKA